MSDLPALVAAADAALKGTVRETAVLRSDAFSADCGAEVWLKCENQQFTGSFKFRGASNRIAGATAQERAAGFVTASTGNHGAGFARAVQAAGVEGIVFVPEHASPAKLANMKRYGATLEVFGTDGVDTEMHAREFADKHGRVFVSPYNDPLVAAGQGTVAMELARQLSAPADVVYVSVGGGGLISGIAAALKTAWPSVRIVGCSPENSKVMIDSVRAGEILDLPSLPTLSDGTAGGVEPGAITFDYIREFVDDFETVTEDEIAEGMRLCMRNENQVVEGAAGVAVAAMLKQRATIAGERAIVVLCGGNTSESILCDVLAGEVAGG